MLRGLYVRGGGDASPLHKDGAGGDLGLRHNSPHKRARGGCSADFTFVEGATRAPCIKTGPGEIPAFPGYLLYKENPRKRTILNSSEIFYPTNQINHMNQRNRVNCFQPMM